MVKVQDRRISLAKRSRRMPLALHPALGLRSIGADDVDGELMLCTASLRHAIASWCPDLVDLELGVLVRVEGGRVAASKRLLFNQL
jgi:hypothetical protein